ncbi:hypothetical protein AA14337_0697 [Acetobacter malorum DSM 14337]|uniref:Uncharacterized protein n=1 Tax=Acetobacter malorum DSM 14337 TaxID=1307910 RepID=A0ABQ0PP19_9PROT|nr:hypothetical protein AD930_08285 [Acetobacter malorum]GBQ77049.1 hypothetical protein AA14337_0697 [Acetobacter malorum DSM 14337]
MKVVARLSCVSVLTALGVAGLPLEAFAQAGASGLEAPPRGRCTADGSIKLCAAGLFALRFYGADGTLRSLAASLDKEADYLPWRLEGRRQGNGFAHLGDIDFRLKTEGTPRWKDFSSWHAKRPVRVLPAEGNVLRQDEITPSLGAGFPLRVRRVWRLAGQGLVLEFSVANPGRQSVQVGGMGFPLVFGNDFTDETLDEAHKHEVFGHVITQDPRVWIAGLSDEGGAGSYVAAAMKELDNPDPQEVAKLEQFATKTVVGQLQVASGPTEGGVRKSLFYYDPVPFPAYYNAAENWKTWASWSRQKAADIGRAYNYPHVAIVHWVLYRLARNHKGLVQQHDAGWYLHKAAITMTAMMQQAPYYTQYGLMEGDVFVEILKDLKRENLTAEAQTIESLMKKRETVWKGQRYPYGSEMAWDSTGQPEVYAWLRYFGDTAQAEETRDAILAYDPALPSWGYNGNARRYWDFLYAGKIARIERQIHHYGSALNAVPLFSAFQAQSTDFYMLRVAYGGLMGALTNIDPQGFGSAAFHSAPDVMRFDAYSGDYGMGFYGHAIATQVDVVKHPEFGWQAFGGLLHEEGDGSVTITPKDSARSRIFVADAGVFLTLESGKFESIHYNLASQDMDVTLAPAETWTPTARLRGEYPAGAPAHVYGVSPAVPKVRDAWEVPLHTTATVLHLHAMTP